MKRKTLLIPNNKYNQKRLSRLNQEEEEITTTSPQGTIRSFQEPQSPNLSNINSSQKSSRSKQNNNHSSLNSPGHLLLTEEAEGNINETSLNGILSQLAQNLNFDQYQFKQIKPNMLHNQKKFEEFSSFQYDCTLYKQLDIEIIFDMDDKANSINSKVKDKIDIFNREIETFFTNKDNFSYYEFSNSQIISSSLILNPLDQINFEGLFQKDFLDKILQTQNKVDSFTKIRKVKYITSMNSLYQKFIKLKSEFYVITPMTAFYFCLLQKYNLLGENFAVLLSNTQLIDKKLNDNNIIQSKIDETLNESPSLIRKLFTTLFFNWLVNEYDDKAFNVFAPFDFDEGIFHQSKVTVKSVQKKGQWLITVQIFGCVFQSGIKKIVDFLNEESKKYKNSLNFSFSIRFTKYPNTHNYYMMNKNLKNPIEKVEFKNNTYYIK